MTASGGSDSSYEERPFRFASSLEVFTLVVWEVLLVFLWMIFSPAGGNAYEAIGLPQSLLYRIVSLNPLFVHSLALPLAGVLVLVTVSVFDINEKEALRHQTRHYSRLLDVIGRDGFHPSD